MQSDLKGQRSLPRAKYRHGVWLGGEGTPSALLPRGRARSADTQDTGLVGWTQHGGTSAEAALIASAFQQVAGESQGRPSPIPAVASAAVTPGLSPPELVSVMPPKGGGR